MITYIIYHTYDHWSCTKQCLATTKTTTLFSFSLAVYHHRIPYIHNIHSYINLLPHLFALLIHGRCSGTWMMMLIISRNYNKHWMNHHRYCCILLLMFRSDASLALFLFFSFSLSLSLSLSLSFSYSSHYHSLTQPTNIRQRDKKRKKLLINNL